MVLFIFTLLILKSEGFLLQLESEPKINGLTYRLYNSYNINGSTLSPNNEKDSVTFLKDKPCVVITHGYFRNIDTNSVQDIVNAYLESGLSVNIIAADWREKASGLYEAVVQRVPEVGADISRFIGKLIDLGLCSAESTHLIGHSLGAHAMGNAGKTFQTEKGMKISRITGLDPAGPGYGQEDTNPRLEPGDAECVDAIHTGSGRLGSDLEVGQVDFYPNGGGPYQPGCFIISLICSHKRAFQFYAKSVKKENVFKATKCGSYNDYKADKCEANPTMLMGYPANCKIRGNFYLDTGSKSPFIL